MSLKFNPPKQIARYALFVDYGTSAFFKTYNDVGFAKTALPHHNYNQRNAAKILEMVEGEWYTLYDIPAGTSRQDLPWKKKRTGWSYYNSESRVAKPMTRDEYAEWRLQVEREKIENKFDISLASL